ncbi:hypothetical protein ZWY2020_021390 [Hordeum vulgare]|nr:hypothetical protein ZWY2020_021390 [Hordeum vulgare]
MVDDGDDSGFTGGTRGRKARTRSQTTLGKTKAKPSIPVDLVVEEAEPDASLLSNEEEEKLHPGYAHHNNEEDHVDEEYILAEF